MFISSEYGKKLKKKEKGKTLKFLRRGFFSFEYESDYLLALHKYVYSNLLFT